MCRLVEGPKFGWLPALVTSPRRAPPLPGSKSEAMGVSVASGPVMNERSGPRKTKDSTLRSEQSASVYGGCTGIAAASAHSADATAKLPTSVSSHK